MSMKKKVGIGVIVLALTLAIGFGINALTSNEAVKGAKAISITVMDVTKDKEIYKETLHTDAESLDVLLSETADLKAVMEDSTYGKLLTSLLSLEQDMNAGPWWLFESANNKVCVEQTICPSLDKVMISDQDAFVFEYTTTFD